MQLFLGFLLAAFIAYLAYRLGALSRSGGLAAMLVGTLIFGLGGWSWTVLLLTFFITSSSLSRAFAGRKHIFSERFSKSSQRDAGQVLANGGLGTILVLFQAFLPHQDWTWMAFAGAMAAVSADTWATELGVLSPFPARLITNGKVVDRGVSGGVTILGYLAAAGGAFLIGLGSVAFKPVVPRLGQVVTILLAGLVGSTVDSLLGASVQAIYFCPRCQKETERHPLHSCGTSTVHQRGWRWLNNDLVNVICSLVGAGVALIVWGLFF